MLRLKLITGQDASKAAGPQDWGSLQRRVSGWDLSARNRPTFGHASSDLELNLEDKPQDCLWSGVCGGLGSTVPILGTLQSDTLFIMRVVMLLMCIQCLQSMSYIAQWLVKQ